ncbi:aminopeptidase M1 [Rhynchospora pubera]|uniref:Aminopeptidase n=1 Tax=Rhynchospora pubera TaxID=906938 RepID=A0AAV8CQ67_9POAL|nr:aminopeptidase M1 [Rhynchospora pubera]
MAEEHINFRGQPRLPNFAVPRHYDIFLMPDLSACLFSGSVTITIDVLLPTRFLVLNAADLSIDAASICLTTTTITDSISLVLTEVVEEDEILVLQFDSDLPLGQSLLRIAFSGTLNDEMRGFYRSKYEYKGEEINMAVTQFESVDARRCFPCWDEPAFKAKFKITLEVPSELVALSNMPISEEKLNGDLKTVSYDESPLMSTYLVAIVTGHFDYIQGHTPDGVQVRVYTQVGKTDQGKFALDVALKSLNLYKDYFAVPYPLPKLDMVAIPDFADGAMENYGLVTYRELALLFDEQLSSAINRQDVAITVAHELAHQWFGNLVTMEWWTHLWLNEGFASWVSYLAVDAIFPEWKTWTQFLDETSSGMTLDALSESHPIEVEIKHANEVDAIFDSISYEKGASVIRMLHSYLGADCFQKALASYIKKYAYANAKTEDLWAVLEEESGEPVKDLMSSWTKQQGYPVIFVKMNSNKLHVCQEQFLSDGSSASGTWIVPLTLCCSSYENSKKLILTSKSDELDIDDLIINKKGKQETFWLKLNTNQTGFYRVKYDDELAAGLKYAIQADKLSLMDKIGIIDDASALCVACKVTLSSLLSLLDAYSMESDYTVLSRVVSVSLEIANMVDDATPDLSDKIKLFLIKLLKTPAEKLGWDVKEGESHLDTMLRAELLMALVRLGHINTVKEGIRRFHIFLNDRNSSVLPPDIRKVAYVAVMQKCTVSDKYGYESLLKIYREADQSQEKVRVLGSLTSCPDKSIVLDALNFLLTDEVRNQDAFHGLNVTNQGREAAWEWLKENWEYISKTWVSTSLISDFINSIVSLFASYEKIREIEEFFKNRVKPTFERALKQSLETVKTKEHWIEGVRSDESLAEVVSYLAGKA